MQHVGGAEIDPFACEVAKLSLILADYPNANGWMIEEADLFAKGALAARLEGMDVILCNPPFEAFTGEERAKYPEAHAIDGSKAVFALATALWARPKMLGFVVPNTLLVDRRYREQRRLVEGLYREVELVSLPDGVFNVSQLDTALVIARDLRAPGVPQSIRSSAVYDADKHRFAVNRTASHTTTQTRYPEAPESGKLWIPALEHVWSALRDSPTLGQLVRGHWGLRWHGGQKGATRVFDTPGHGRIPGYMDSSALDQFVLRAPRYIDARREVIYAGVNYNWDAPKILANAGRLSRGYWRLAAAVDRGGRIASQQFMAFWPNESVQNIDLDAVTALLNGPVVNAFLAEHSFDKRFRIRTLEQAPIPKHIPPALGEFSRTYSAAASQPDSDPEELASLLGEIDALTLEAYALADPLKRDLRAAFGTSERPVRGLTSRRRSRVRPQAEAKSTLSLFSDPYVEGDAGEDLGRALSPADAARQLRSISRAVPIDQWAGGTLTAGELRKALSVRPRDLAKWLNDGTIVGFPDKNSIDRYPLEQFVQNSPVAGLDEIVAATGDPRVAWLWLRQPHVMLNRRRPIDILKANGIERLRSLVARDFR